MSLREALRIIAADKARLVLALSAVAVVATSAVTFGSWSVSSSAGSGYSEAKLALNLTLSDASASTTAQLYPGGISLAGKVAMSNASDNSCQGAVFTVPITLAATS